MRKFCILNVLQKSTHVIKLHRAKNGMEIHSSISAWRIPWTEEPGGLESWAHKESDMTEKLTHYTYMHTHK